MRAKSSNGFLNGLQCFLALVWLPATSGFRRCAYSSRSQVSAISNGSLRVHRSALNALYISIERMRVLIRFPIYAFPLPQPASSHPSPIPLRSGSPCPAPTSPTSCLLTLPFPPPSPNSYLVGPSISMPVLALWHISGCAIAPATPHGEVP